MNDLPSSGELSDKAKKVFAEEAENLLLLYGLLDTPLNLDEQSVS
ncbi:hypothetical protein ACFORL_08075 [Legionella dresdenensis]|uniref:Uncharacterized protein n=1 Tax=Legionella dresdenensis TaxID=450200 RepID=A0ABV8CFF7_9GAMM